jgi:hypothetical protein
LNKEAKNFQAIYSAKKAHDVDCQSAAKAIGLSYFDMERMGWEEGDVVAGLPLTVDGGQAGGIRIICDGIHAGNHDSEEVGIDEPQEADADAPNRRQREVVPA